VIAAYQGAIEVEIPHQLKRQASQRHVALVFGGIVFDSDHSYLYIQKSPRASFFCMYK
jgi:hypothetical protein